MVNITLKKNVSSSVENTIRRYLNVPGHKLVRFKTDQIAPDQLTDKQLTSEYNKNKKKVKTDATGIKNTQTTITKQQAVIDKTDDFLSKQNGYKTRKAAYDHAAKTVTDLQKQLAKAKTAKDKKSITAKIKDAKKDQTAAYKDLKKVTSSKSYQTKLSEQSKARRALKNAKKKLANLKSKKKKDKAAYNVYKKEKAKRAAAAKRKKQKANLSKIKSKIKAHKKQPLVGQTALYRADLMSSVVYFLGEVQPTETDTSEVTSIGVDNSDPRAGKSTRTSKELSGTYWLFGKSYAAACKQFNAIQKLQRLDTEFVIKGFSNWNHVKISSISKTVSGLARSNALELSITFEYVKQGKILYGKAKKKTKKKGAVKSTKKKGSDKGKYKSYTVKSGDTYWGLAQKNHTTVATLTKLNGSRFKTMFPGHKLKIPK